MKDEVYLKLDADTLRMIHDENMTNLKPFDDEGFYRVDKALYGHRGSPRYWKDAVAEAAKDLGLKPSKIDNSLYMDPRNVIQYVHVDDELISGDDRLVRDMVQKLKQKFLVKKIDYLSKVGDKIQILGRTVERTRLGVQTHNIETTHRSKFQRHGHGEVQSCEHARSPSDRKRLGDRGAAPRRVGRIVSSGDRPTSLCCRTTTRYPTRSERTCARTELPNKHSIGHG